MREIGEGIGLNRIIVSVEAHRLYSGDLERLELIGDPRVLARIRFAETLSEDQIAEAYAKRAEVVTAFEQLMNGFDAALTPALMRLPPSIAEVEADFDRLNAAMLRNTSLVNLVNGCAVVMPTAGLTPGWSMTMLVGKNRTDALLFAAVNSLNGADETV